MPDVHSLGPDAVSSHAWNGNATELVAPRNEFVDTYSTKGADWKRDQSMAEHAQRVMCVDWAPKSNRIVTCGADRNSFVWNRVGNEWKPTLVVLRIDRAAVCCRWSPLETKFAVGSGSKMISVCYFEQDNDWWVSKHIKKPLRSTVSALDWHPNNVLLASASCDFKARVFSAFVKDVDEKPAATAWGSKLPFNTVVGEFDTGSGGGWVHDVRFNASGDKLAWVAHDSTISVVDCASKDKVFTLPTRFLPFKSLIWLSSKALVAAGHDCIPVVFELQPGDKLQFCAQLEATKAKETTDDDEEPKISAMERFKRRDQLAQEKVAGELASTHQNKISQLRAVESDRSGAVTRFSSSGADGNIVVWNVKDIAMQQGIAALKL